MSREVQVSLNLKEIPLNGIGELAFGGLKLDLEALAQQPPIEVLPCYRESKIDYEIGYRHIRVVATQISPLQLEYKVRDRASVEESVNHSVIVGRKTYTQEEVDALRNPPRDPRMLYTEIID